MTFAIDSQLSSEERTTLDALQTPIAIQAFLDASPYRPEYSNLSPLEVLRQRKAHCLDGGVFAAMALRRLGFRPLLIDLFPDPGMDDDHVLAIFALGGRWGAVAKSNFVGLRYRDPVYHTQRELIMSYFEQFYNVNRVKTLRTYTPALNLQRLDHLRWETDSAGVDAIEKILLSRRRIALLPASAVEHLVPVDEISYRAGLSVANPDGLYQPRNN